MLKELFNCYAMKSKVLPYSIDFLLKRKTPRERMTNYNKENYKNEKYSNKYEELANIKEFTIKNYSIYEGFIDNENPKKSRVWYVYDRNSCDYYNHTSKKFMKYNREKIDGFYTFNLIDALIAVRNA